MGEYVSVHIVVPLGATCCLFLAIVFLLIAFGSFRRGVGALVSMSLCFVLLGVVRAQLPDLHLLPAGLLEVSYDLSSRLQSVISGSGLSPDSQGLLSAMLLGHRSELSSHIVELYRQTGGSHILALSGLHLGILFGVFNFALLRVLIYRWRYLVGSLGLLLIWCYALLTGFPVSLCRASLMLSLLVLSEMRMTGHDSVHTLFMSAMILLLVSPSMLYDVGFQLSFMSVLGLILFYHPLVSVWSTRQFLIRWLWQAWCVSLAAQLGVLPLLLHYFHSFSIFGVLLSPLFVLLATLIIYVSLGYFLMFSLGLGFLLRGLTENLIGLQHGVMSFVSHFSFNRVELAHFSSSQVLLTYAACMCLLPVLHALRVPEFQTRGYRVAMFFRAWPYLLSILLLLLTAYLLAD